MNELYLDIINIFVKILGIPDLYVYKNSVNWASVSMEAVYSKNLNQFI